MSSGQGTLMVRDRVVPAAADVHWQHLQKIGARQHHDLQLNAQVWLLPKSLRGSPDETFLLLAMGHPSKNYWDFTAAADMMLARGKDQPCRCRDPGVSGVAA